MSVSQGTPSSKSGGEGGGLTIVNENSLIVMYPLIQNLLGHAHVGTH